jgi:hypothetical protein
VQPEKLRLFLENGGEISGKYPLERWVPLISIILWNDEVEEVKRFDVSDRGFLLLDVLGYAHWHTHFRDSFRLIS